MKMTLAEIALFIGGTVIGADDTIINNIRSIEEANEGDLTFIANKKYLKKLKLTKASAILAPPQTAASTSPARIMRAAVTIAFAPEVQAVETV